MSENTKLKPSQRAGRPLYQIAREYGEVLDELEALAEQNDGVLPDEAAESFTRLEGEVAQKLENCAMVVRALQQQADTIKQEEQRLRALRKGVEADADRLKDYTAMNMARVGLKRSDGTLLKVRIQANPPKAIVTDLGAVPDDFCVVHLTMSAQDYRRVVDIVEQHQAEHGVIWDNPDEDWRCEREVRTKPIIAEWKASAGAFEVEGIEIVQNTGLRIW